MEACLGWMQAFLGYDWKEWLVIWYVLASFTHAYLSFDGQELAVIELTLNWCRLGFALIGKCCQWFDLHWLNAGLSWLWLGRVASDFICGVFPKACLGFDGQELAVKELSLNWCRLGLALIGKSCQCLELCWLPADLSWPVMWFVLALCRLVLPVIGKTCQWLDLCWFHADLSGFWWARVSYDRIELELM